MISGANKQQYGKLKDELANNYLLGLDYYPNTCEKALQVLGNYKVTGGPRPPRGKVKSRVAFLQQGGQGQGSGRGGQGQGAAGRGGASVSGADTRGGESVGSGGSADRAPARRMKQAGDLHCYNCGSLEHWVDECPELSLKQQVQLYMAVEGNEEQEEVKEGHQLLNMTLMQGTALPENRAYLDGCSTVTAFKSNKYLKNVRTVKQGIRINCNAGAVTIHQKGMYRKLNVRYLPHGTANIFSMHELEQQYSITYNSWEGTILRPYAQRGGEIP